MKKRHVLMLTCLLAAMLWGCSGGSTSPEATAPASQALLPTGDTLPETQPAADLFSGAAEGFEAVWNGSGTFTDYRTEAVLDIHRIAQIFTPTPLSAAADSFSMVDLDQDGTEEMILWVNQEFEEYSRHSTPVILRYQDGFLYAQALTFADFQNVKTDGSFHFFYPDTGNFGYATMVFADGVWKREELAEAKTGDNGEITYYVNGEATARGLFRNTELAQIGKPDVIFYSDWYVYQQESAAPADVPAAAADAIGAYGEVFNGTKDIYRTASSEWIPLSKLSLFFTPNELPWTVAQIAVLDLDEDGTPEVVAEVSDYTGFLFLRAQADGTVHGSEIWYRAFQDLKADGSYRGSGSSFNRSYWKNHHAGDILLAECYEDESGHPVYWLDGREVGEAEFTAFEELQNQKPDALWYPSWENYLASAQ